VEAALAATRSAGLPPRYELRLRKLLVEAYENVERWDDAGRAGLDALDTVGSGMIDRRSYQEALDRAVANLRRANETSGSWTG